MNSAGWKQALRQAGIEDYRWHDLRHAFATLHLQAGPPTVRVAGAGRLVLVGDGETLCAFTAGHLASDVERFGAKVGIPEPSGYDLATLKEAALSDIAPTL